MTTSVAAVRVRDATLADAETVHAMLRSLAVFQRQGEEFYATVEEVRRDGFGARPLYETILAEVDGRPAGLAVFFPGYSTFKARPTLFVDSLWVEEWARRHAIGRRLLAEICRRAVARDCWRVDLHVLDWNPAAQFYERVGFLETIDRVRSIEQEPMRRLAGEAG